jgi:glycosyltransferase involved in cell wall biosynthesis
MPETYPLVSIVIPCYNSGAFIMDALNSIQAHNKRLKEVVIVDDGSTDLRTLELLDDLRAQGRVVISQENKGPAAARNTGVKASTGKYILFLDSDNMLLDAYIEKAAEVLDRDESIGVVYGNPDFFGDVTDERLFAPKAFDLTTIMLGNYIDVCAMVRRKAWKDVGGLDENRAIIGYEDWDFWIMIGTAGWRFKHINEPLFNYRIRKDSLIKQASDKNYVNEMFRYIYTKHWKIMLLNYEALFYQYEYYRADQKRPFRSFLKNFTNRFIKRKPIGILGLPNRSL